VYFVVIYVFFKLLLPSGVTNHHCWLWLDRISLWRHLVNHFNALAAIVVICDVVENAVD